MAEVRPEDYFPYPEFRKYQREVISFAYGVMLGGRIGLVHAPCGIGKSIAVLTAFLMAREAGLGDDAKLMVLTRTKAQLEIYVREVRRLREEKGVVLRAAVFASRQDMCPLRSEREALAKARYKDFLRVCKELRRMGSCPYYEETYGRKLRPSSRALSAMRKLADLGASLPGETVSICHDEGVCAYEVVKCLMRRADIMVGNYNYLLLRPVREAILWRFGADLPELNCVVDEAHNIDKWAVDVMSDEISSTSFRRADKEADEYAVEDRGLMSLMADVIDKMGLETYRLYGPEYERLIDPEVLADMLVSELGLTSDRLLFSFLRFLEG
ncbi:hypothetical protein DRO32_02715, partial [Candidatus Bathyarchaeota archaeon]